MSPSHQVVHIYSELLMPGEQAIDTFLMAAESRTACGEQTIRGGIDCFLIHDRDTTSATSRYQVVGGRVAIPDVPGFGIELDQERFEHAVARTGSSRTL